jgi:hypothetical protein
MDEFFPDWKSYSRIIKKMKGEHSQIVKNLLRMKNFSYRSKEIQNYLKESINKDEVNGGGNRSNPSQQTKLNLLQIPPFNPNSRKQILKKSSKSSIKKKKQSSEKKHHHSQSRIHVKFDTAKDNFSDMQPSLPVDVNSKSPQGSSSILQNSKFFNLLF